MITIALDEKGVFDTGYTPEIEDGEPTLIGGVLFDDVDNPEELQNERKRLDAYFNCVIDEVNSENGLSAEYPKDLHMRDGNGHIIPKVKRKIERTLKEFIEKGSFKGRQLPTNNPLPEREGKYYVCAVVKSERGKSDLLKSDLGTFFRDGVASNIYFHMISDVVEHLIFHNPLIPDAKVFRLDIATRESANISESDSKDIYEKQGFINRNKDDLDIEHYQVMNSDIFRTILTEQMLSSSKKDIQIDTFYVNSIVYDYKRPRRNKQLRNEDQIFMFLADMLCSYISHNVDKYDITELNKRAKELTGENTLIFSYDETDEKLKKALRFLEQNEYYDALSETYDIKNMNTKESSLYNSRWVPFIEKAVIKKVNEEMNGGEKTSHIYEAIQKLRNSYYSNRLNSEKSFYIFNILKRACSKIKSGTDIDRLEFFINEIGLTAYCHRGDTEKATPYFKACERLAYAVGISDYIVVRNRYATSLMDVFDYELAIHIIRQTAEILRGINDLSRKTFGSRRKPIGKEDLGKVMSLAGQCASFMGDNESAQLYFDEAITLLCDFPANRKITESYKLHHLIDSENEMLYHEAFTDYTKGFENYKNQLVVIQAMADQGIVNLRYALYLYLKGLYTFGSYKEIKGVWTDIKRLEKSIDIKEKKGHPWELIYKYLCLLAIRIKEKNSVVRYTKALEELEQKTRRRKDLVRIIILGSLARVYHEQDNSSDEMKKYLNMFGLFSELYPGSVEKANISDDESKKVFLEEKLRYMYC